MGVPGLLRVATTRVAPERVDLTRLAAATPSGVTLAVDVCALGYHLYRSLRIPFVTGGDFAALAVSVAQYVDGLRVRGVMLYGVVDGMRARGKRCTTKARLEKAAGDMLECVRCVHKFGAEATAFEGQGPFVAPPLMVATVVSALKQAGVHVERAAREADARLSYLARRPGGPCFAVLSNDSDFLVFDGSSPLIRFDDITMADPAPPEYPEPFCVARLYHRASLAKSLGIHAALMPALASLVGTDSTPARPELHDRLSSRRKGRSHRKRVSGTCDVVMAAASFLVMAAESSKMSADSADLIAAAGRKDTHFDAILASLLFGSKSAKSRPRKGCGRGNNKKQKTNRMAGWIEYLNIGRTLYQYDAVFCDESRSDAAGEVLGAAVASRVEGVGCVDGSGHVLLSAQVLRSLNKSALTCLARGQFEERYRHCDYLAASRLAQIIVDRQFYWGRPPLEASLSDQYGRQVDSASIYARFLPVRKRLYAFLFGVTRGSEALKKKVEDASVALALPPVEELVRTEARFRWVDIHTCDGDSADWATLPCVCNFILFGDSKGEVDNNASALLSAWSAVDSGELGWSSLPKALCQLVWDAGLVHDGGMPRRLEECRTSMANALTWGSGAARNPGANATSEHVSLPEDFLQRLTLYSQLQVAYIHLSMVLQACGEAQPALPAVVFRRMPAWVRGLM